ncbi:MAG: hypothetical protein QMC67_01595 [Candidatus Wallbacteria bacterium]
MLIAGIDPGSNKFGIAVINEKRKILYRKIVRMTDTDSGFDMKAGSAINECVLAESLAGSFVEINKKIGAPDVIVMGNGTTSQIFSRVLGNIKPALMELSRDLKIITADEYCTTQTARELYRNSIELPFILKYIIPKSLIPVTCDIDDYAAAAIAISYLK